MEQPGQQETQGGQRGMVFWVAVGAVGTLLAGLAAIFGPQIQGIINDNPETASPTASPSTTSAAPGSTTGTADPVLPSTARWEVTTEDFSSTEWCKWPGNTGFSWDSLLPRIAGESYSWGFGCALRRETARGHVMFLVPNDATVFRAVVGLEDTGDCTSSVRFEVQDAFTAEVLDRAATRPGRAATVDAPLNAATKLKLQVSFEDVGSSPWDESCEAVWAEPQFEATVPRNSAPAALREPPP